MNSQAGKNKLFITLGGVAALALIVLYSAGVFTTGKIAPGVEKGAPHPAAGAGGLKAELVRVPEFYQAVGSLRPLSEATVEAQVPGRVAKVLARAGQTVEKGQLLAQLDDQQFQAKLAQARQGLAAARANFERAKSEYERVTRFAQAEAATPQNLEQARAGFLAAQAGLGQAQQMDQEAEVALGYTRLTAPASGQVVRRLAEPGDMAMPGKPLLVVQTVGGLRLEALVREGLIGRMEVGAALTVEVPSLDKQFKGRVEEVVPAADPQTRSFLVKVGLEPEPGLRSGMFARLLVPLEERGAVLIPRAALRRVGQLELVRIRAAGGWESVYVTTGREIGDKIEVLSGLKGGEELAGGGDES